MYKVFLVDDEIVIREGIRNGFPWDESEFTLVGEAPDGEMALPMIVDLKPDILITDIRMPFMDGLSLSRRVMKVLPWVSIIILSGHDDFEYAQQAISIGVRQYLLKPVTPRKLEEALETLAGKITQERALRADTALLQQKLASSERIAREQLVTRLLEGSAGQEVLLEAQTLGMPLEAQRYLVMMLGETADDTRLGLIGCMHRLLEGLQVGAYCITSLESPALLLLQTEAETGADALEERAYALAQALEHEARQNGLRLPALAIGSPVSRLTNLPQALASARAVLKADAGRAPRIVSSLDADLSQAFSHLEGSRLPLFERLLYAPTLEGDALIADFFAGVGQGAQQSLLVLNYLLMDVLLAASRVIRQCGGDPAAVLPSRFTQQAQLVQLAQSPQSALDAAREMAAAALSFRDKSAASRYGETIRLAKQYIEDNVHRADMTLQDVAGHVALSNNHFSTVFSQEVGQTFTEYVTGVRLNRAKQLLSSTADRSVEIAQAIGYSDPHYFSYLFKKQVGLSPRDFRKSLAREE